MLQMESNAIKKNILLLVIGSLLALHLNAAEAGIDESKVNNSSGVKKCVITEDQYRRIN